MDDLELEILSLLPKVTDTNILEQVAFILDIEVDENMRGPNFEEIFALLLDLYRF